MKTSIFILMCLIALKGHSKNQTCQSLSDYLKQPHPAQHGINVSLSQMVSLEYVRHTLARNYHPEDLVCTEVLVMSKNEYQYYRYFIRLNVIPFDTNAKPFIHYLYFQDASTQAFHNYFAKPWIGLDGQEVEIYLSLLKSTLQLKLAKISSNEKKGYITLSAKDSKELLEQVQKTKPFQAQIKFLNPGSLSFLQLDKTSFIVTWMSRLSNTGNPFLDAELSQGFYFEFNSKLGLFEGFPFRPAFDGVKNKDGISQNIYEHLELNLTTTQKKLTNDNKAEHLFDLRIEGSF